ncbi:hypothetical protein J5N97_025771 [Dioscorea zingiberensis]|uniref:Uncharacterized protein n=1 Tax=Dioscorea zingiberensis TaxID=325984 RepID=A0A9D5C280_9LILI|nr:hypothetical protein J5N97_025771 [Dioscorea zingiberensis]
MIILKHAKVMASDIDVAKFLFDHKPSVDALIDYLCNDFSEVCFGKPPPVPKDRLPGEPFVPKPSKEDVMNLNNFGSEDENEDEDEEDEFPANLWKVSVDKDGHKKDIK